MGEERGGGSPGEGEEEGRGTRGGPPNERRRALGMGVLFLVLLVMGVIACLCVVVVALARVVLGGDLVGWRGGLGGELESGGELEGGLVGELGGCLPLLGGERITALEVVFAAFVVVLATLEVV